MPLGFVSWLLIKRFLLHQIWKGYLDLRRGKILEYTYLLLPFSLIMQQNIFHGAMSLDQLYLARPTYSQPCYQRQPKGVYLCGSGSHPGELLM